MHKLKKSLHLAEELRERKLDKLLDLTQKQQAATKTLRTAKNVRRT